MKRASLALVFLMALSAPLQGGLLDDMLKGMGTQQQAAGLDDETVGSGLKEALALGTERAVTSVSKVDGYFGNEMIKILMPEKIQKVADVLKKVGYQRQVDDFVLSMNRAAEKAAPKAASIFGDAIRQMTIDDARKIFSGGDTAATEYFKGKTHDRLYDEFRPVIASSMNEVGVARSYKDMMGKYESIPFMPKETVDLDHYVTNKALDGLFTVVGQEEKRIRTDPVARTTDLLKTVFGR
jgi:hypothetical protein